MGMIRNYFEDLELGPDAGLEDIRRAYKKLARRFHPDLNPFDVQAEESFRRIQEAFDRLNSETRITRFRKQLELAAFRPEPKKSIAKWGGYPLVPKAEQFVKQWVDEPSVKKKHTRPEEKLDFWVSVTLTNSEVKGGVNKRVKYEFEAPCSKCRGSGGRSQSVKATCKRCAGLGNFLIERGAMRWRKACDDCFGKGYVVSSPCPDCDGRGKVAKESQVELRFAKDVDVSKGLVLKGLGHISFDGKRRGNLCVQIVQK